MSRPAIVLLIPNHGHLKSKRQLQSGLISQFQWKLRELLTASTLNDEHVTSMLVHSFNTSTSVCYHSTERTTLHVFASTTKMGFSIAIEGKKDAWVERRGEWVLFDLSSSYS